MDNAKKLQEYEYLMLLRKAVKSGKYRKPDDEEGRYELFGEQLKFDLTGNTIPLLTTKKVYFRSLAAEMLWFLSGSQNIQLLRDNNVKIWDAWANDSGDVGALYGYQWRHWQVDKEAMTKYPERYKHVVDGEIDQLKQVMNTLANRPEARSHVMTCWRPDHLPLMSIKPCHGLVVQFYAIDNELSCCMYQRSCDLFLGVPFNIAQYSLLTHMVAHQLGMQAKEFIWNGGDTHIYENHVEQANQQLENPILRPPTLSMVGDKPDAIDRYTLDNFRINNYEHAKPIKADVSLQGKPGTGVAL